MRSCASKFLKLRGTIHYPLYTDAGDAVVYRVVRQSPAIASDTADYDIELYGIGCFGISLETVA